MGRSQVKFRATHGRGRGGGRGAGGNGEDGEHAWRRSGGGRRPLESNAFRYAEERGGEQKDEGGDDVASAQPFRRQFFASEDEVRGPSARPSGAYFQSQTVKQWDEDDESDPSAKSGGVLDFAWLGEQLAQVAPSIRYQMDPKYCVDFEFEPQDQLDSEEEEEEEEGENAGASSEETAQASMKSVTAASTTPASSTHAATPPVAPSADTELDMLLQLSSSAPSTAARPTSASITTPSGASTAGAGVQHTASDASEQLEDWLDDVLDM